MMKEKPKKTMIPGPKKLSSRVLLRFINRGDCYGVQYVKNGEKANFTAKEEFNEDVADKHIAGTKCVGLHTTNPDTNLCNWGINDVDSDKADKKTQKENLEAALKIHEIMTEKDVKGWINLSGGIGRYHIGFFCKPMDAMYVFNFLNDVRKEAEKRLGREIPGEVYPKQPYISKGSYGNWVKLPLGKHPVTKKRCVLIMSSGKEHTLEDSIKLLRTMPDNDIPKIGTPIIASEYENQQIERQQTKNEITAPCYKRMLENGASPGNRHYCMMSIVHWGYQNGYTKEDVRRDLTKFNRNCDEPKHPSEIDREMKFQWDRCERGNCYKIGCKGTGIVSQELSSHCAFENKDKCTWLNVGKQLNEVEDRSMNDNVMSQYIFDEKKVLKKKPFAMGTIDDENMYIGQLLPKTVDVTDKNGDVVGKTQEWKPVLIFSNHELHEVNKQLELKYKIKIPETPQNLNTACSLECIEGWLSKDYGKVDEKALFDMIRERYKKFMFFIDENWYDVHALWDIGTYMFNLFHVFPIMEMRGLAGTAKTKVMKISRMMTLNSSDILINPSAPSLFRETHSKRWAKYIDEAEKFYRYDPKTRTMEADDRAELINGSYSRGSVVPRVEKIGTKFVTVYYEVYSPSMISSIRGLHGATETRAITHIMTKAGDEDERGEMEIEDYAKDEEWEEIKARCFVFTLQNWGEILTEYSRVKAGEHIKKRDFQLWRPLLSIAKFIDDDLYKKIEKFASKISKRKREDFIREGSLEYKIIHVVKEMIDNGSRLLHVKDIVFRYKLAHSEEETSQYFNRTVSNKLDNMGFKDFREKDREGSYFVIEPETFEAIVLPILPSILSSQSSQSSQESTTDNDNDIKKCDEPVTNRDDNTDSSQKKDHKIEPTDNENKGKVVTNCDENDDT